jgi:hypothetical protein
MLSSDVEVTVLYVRNPRLGENLKDVAARYASRVKLVAVAKMPGTRFWQRQPSIRVLRGQSIVCEAMGADLPRRELDRVIRSAL